MQRRFLAILAGILGSMALPAGVVAGSQSPSDKVELGGERASLPVQLSEVVRGVTLVMSPEANARSLAACMVIPAGTSTEREEESGLAELALAHLWEGAPGLPMPESRSMLESRGVTIRRNVGRDTVSICAALPAQELPLALWLFGLELSTPPPTLAEATALASQVREGAQQYLDELPTEAGAVKLEQLAFQGDPMMDSPPEAAASSLEDRNLANAKAFFERGYQKSRVAIALAGQFEPVQAERLARQYLGRAERQVAATEARSEAEPLRHTSDRYGLMFHPNAADPAVFFGWAVPGEGVRDHEALLLTTAILALGESSRISDRLVRRNRWAKNVEGSLTPSRGRALFAIRVEVAKRANLDAVAKTVHEEIQRLAATGPASDEMDRAVALLRQAHLKRLDSPLERAQILAESWLGDGEPLSSVRRFESLGSIAAEDVRLAARTFLLPNQLTTIEVYPKGYPIQPSAAPMKRYYLVRAGDTLIGIAKVHGVAVSDLVVVNGIKQSDPIFPGQKLVIPKGGRAAPKPTTHTVKKGESLIAIAKKYGVNVSDITRANGISRKKPIIVGQTLTIPPKEQN